MESHTVVSWPPQPPSLDCMCKAPCLLTAMQHVAGAWPGSAPQQGPTSLPEPLQVVHKACRVKGPVRAALGMRKGGVGHGIQLTSIQVEACTPLPPSTCACCAERAPHTHGCCTTGGLHSRMLPDRS